MVTLKNSKCSTRVYDFYQNGSPFQTTLLDRFGWKFCVEPWSQSPTISHMSQKPIEKLQIELPGQSVDLKNYLDYCIDSWNSYCNEDIKEKQKSVYTHPGGRM